MPEYDNPDGEKHVYRMHVFARLLRFLMRTSDTPDRNQPLGSKGLVH